MDSTAISSCTNILKYYGFGVICGKFIIETIVSFFVIWWFIVTILIISAVDKDDIFAGGDFLVGGFCPADFVRG